MQQLITYLCQINNLTQHELTDTLERKHVCFEQLIGYQSPQTGDNLVLYASRFGNLHLLRMINEMCPFAMNRVNRDGKNALHEVN